MWNLKKYNKLVTITKKKQTHIYREQTSGYQWGEGGRGNLGPRGVGGTNYWVQGYKDVLYNMGNIAPCL